VKAHADMQDSSDMKQNGGSADDMIDSSSQGAFRDFDLLCLIFCHFRVTEVVVVD